MMKVKLVQLQKSFTSLLKLYTADMSLSLAHEVGIFTKDVDVHLQTIQELKISLITKYNIKDLSAAAKQNTEEFVKFNTDLDDYLNNTEVEIKGLDLTWSDFDKYKDSIILSPRDEELISVFLKQNCNT